MKALLLIAALAAACKGPKAPVPAAAQPSPDQNRVEKYVGGLQSDVKRAQEVKEKADAANKKSEEAEKIPE